MVWSTYINWVVCKRDAFKKQTTLSFTLEVRSFFLHCWIWSYETLHLTYLVWGICSPRSFWNFAKPSITVFLLTPWSSTRTQTTPTAVRSRMFRSSSSKNNISLYGILVCLLRFSKWVVLHPGKISLKGMYLSQPRVSISLLAPLTSVVRLAIPSSIPDSFSSTIMSLTSGYGLTILPPLSFTWGSFLWLCGTIENVHLI